jgi:hypothetical protein
VAAAWLPLGITAQGIRVNRLVVQRLAGTWTEVDADLWS